MPEKVKENILKILFESPKTTGEITTALGYEKGQYNAIDDTLKTLVAEGFLRSEKKKVVGAPGQPPTFYNIIYEQPILERIQTEYPKLFYTMQGNDTVLSMLIQKHFWLINYKKWQDEYDKYHPASSACEELCRYPQKFTIDSFECNECDQQQECLEIREELKNRLENAQKRLREVFKKFLILSPNLFRRCLNDTPEQLKQKFDKIFSLTFEGQLGQMKDFNMTFGSYSDELDGIEDESITRSLLSSLQVYFHKVFEICVFYDIASEEVNDEAVECLLENNKYKAEISEDVNRIKEAALSGAAKALRSSQARP